ncbi:D-galactosyl-beta-1-_3-N-acetyl-D-hexosamine phosphorylase Cphy3030 [Actinomyces bovis]|uniref:D-galactosyl-beta-1->3-N-acetyl-D-hexosamine phosphorylase Cphy3030 n=1 Tax=Actinomyces bovis TaxID=1658 RepID=A0ABY1VKC3_9ACTO|nr:1,3-beta-galactosyl-N-acetylhexosamine phosphorylase [Actinomyces bovis]SPT52561.1 D-galactosyl-beta-1->3-N-acetyl-D-hexosamine phosphorylase Cphy3030 [Actinomyces bovis]VEG54335.1 D-galactosyl-beta-1->3-N-acetyl-D-hexosamine phosphorylase Cphy3030 [Actinomyces israelii]
MTRTTGRVTMPIQEGIDDQIRELAQALGADAVRNSDGTWLPEIAYELVDKVYSTYFPARGDQEWALAHPDTLVNQYLMSARVTAMSSEPLQIDVLDGYFREQFKPCYERVEKFWEVIDRTSGQVVSVSGWSVDQSTGILTIAAPTAWHEYTVGFLADQIWDTTQMYNYITNGWGETDPTRVKERPYDVRKNGVWEHAKEALSEWLTKHPEVDVVRFTTFFYHFTIAFNTEGKEKFVDWFGYSASVSPEAIDAFEAEYGYELRAEDFVDAGYYNSPFRMPTQHFRDWIDFQSRFVSQRAKGLVDIAHEAGREAMMFLGDNWMGTEPYGPYFPSIGLDAVVGSAGSAATTRLISDIPGVKYTEVRFLPYFFPDVFNHDGGDPVGEANDSWLTSRRAIIRHPLDRMGYGGYVSLALEFPEFIERITAICQEFRDIHEFSGGELPQNAPFTVGILNAWGSLRSWQTHMVAHALWYKAVYSYVGVIESLAGLPFKVRFLSFDEVLEAGVPEEVGVLINAGAAGTSYSGAEAWADGRLAETIRAWVAQGHGFIGVGEPSAYQQGGAYLQLSDVLGVDRERQLTLSTDRYPNIVDEHLVTADLQESFDDGEGAGGDVFALSQRTQVLAYEAGTVKIAVNDFGKGRAVYFSGLPYSAVNSRTLQRALYWAAQREDLLEQWFCSNPNTEVAWYPGHKRFLVTNNAYEQATTTVLGDGRKWEITLEPMGSKWVDVD